MDVFEAALTAARTQWDAADGIRREFARLSKDADARGDQAERVYHLCEATKMQNEMIKYAAAISALTAIVGK